MGFSKDKPAPKPGAEHLDTSKKIVRGGKVEHQEPKGKVRKKKNGAATAVALFSLVFAFLYSEYYAMNSAVVSFFEDASMNKMLFGPGYGVVTADPMIDQVLTILIRAAFFAFVFGVVPFLTARYARSRNVNNQDPYKLMWGMTAFTAFVIVLFDSLLWPFMLDIFAQFEL